MVGIIQEKSNEVPLDLPRYFQATSHMHLTMTLLLIYE